MPAGTGQRQAQSIFEAAPYNGFTGESHEQSGPAVSLHLYASGFHAVCRGEPDVAALVRSRFRAGHKRLSGRTATRRHEAWVELGDAPTVTTSAGAFARHDAAGLQLVTCGLSRSGMSALIRAMSAWNIDTRTGDGRIVKAC